MTTKKNRPKRNWVDKGTDFPGEFKKLCKAEVIQIYSTMIKSKAAFAERAKQSLKNLLDYYLEKFAYKYIQRLPHFITTVKSRKKDLIPKNIKTSDFLSILYCKPLREYRIAKFKIGDRVRISKYG